MRDFPLGDMKKIEIGYEDIVLRFELKDRRKDSLARYIPERKKKEERRRRGLTQLKKIEFMREYIRYLSIFVVKWIDSAWKKIDPNQLPLCFLIH